MIAETVFALFIFGAASAGVGIEIIDNIPSHEACMQTAKFWIEEHTPATATGYVCFEHPKTTEH